MTQHDKEAVLHRAALGETKIPGFSPLDNFNRTLFANVRPPDWINPRPSGRYNLVVVGAGTAGLVAAAGAALLGAKVALVEKNLLGGDCLNFGCVPSKALIRCARAAHDARNMARFGVRVPAGIEVDFPAVMERMRRLRSRISFHDSARRFSDIGVDVFLGEARFGGEQSVVVAGTELRFSRALIATGARAVEPQVQGLAEAGFHTNETVFSLTKLPGRLAVIGGGPLGCELAQAFRRLGSEVVIFHSHSHLLEREDEDAARILQSGFLDEGIRLLLNTTPQTVTRTPGGKLISHTGRGGSGSIVVDEILVGAGRAPNVGGLDLEKAGVEYDERSGVKVNDKLQTSNPRIYAAGDVCLQYKFTHTADATARIVLKNALFHGGSRVSSLTIPWVTYTDPEIAHVGMSAREAERKGVEIDTYIKPLAHVDRALLDGEEQGFVKIHTRKGTDTVLGATIVARHAGEMISELSLVVASRIGLGAVSELIHPYPTQSEATRGAADLYNRSRLVTPVKKVLSFLLLMGRNELLLKIGDGWKRVKELIKSV